MNNLCILYIPVESKFLNKWEYYNVDINIIRSLFSEIIIINNLYDFLKVLIRKYIFINHVYCWWWHQSLPIILICKIFKIKCITTGAIHYEKNNLNSDYFHKNILYKIAVKTALYLSDFNLFISKNQFDEITSNFIVRNPLLVTSSLNNNFCFNNEEIKSNILLRNNSSVLKITTIIWHKIDQYKRKGLFESIEALLLLKNMSINFQFNIIGEDGGDLNFLIDYIYNLGLQNNISFSTNATVEEKNNILLNSHIYIQPSHFEGFGNATLEAMSFGVPIIVSNKTAQKELGYFGGVCIEEIDSKSILNAILLIYNEVNSYLYIKRCLLVFKNAHTIYSYQNRFNKLKMIFINE